MSNEAFSLIQQLLAKDPAIRLGSSLNDLANIKNHPFFKDIDWQKVNNRNTTPQYIPSAKSQTEFRYFQSQWQAKIDICDDFDLLDEDLDTNEQLDSVLIPMVSGFSYFRS